MGCGIFVVFWFSLSCLEAFPFEKLQPSFDDPKGREILGVTLRVVLPVAKCVSGEDLEPAENLWIWAGAGITQSRWFPARLGDVRRQCLLWTEGWMNLEDEDYLKVPASLLSAEQRLLERNISEAMKGSWEEYGLWMGLNPSSVTY